MKKPDDKVSLLPLFIVLFVALLVFCTPWRIWSSLFSGLMPGKAEPSPLNESVKIWVSLAWAFTTARTARCSEKSLPVYTWPRARLYKRATVLPRRSPAVNRPQFHQIFQRVCSQSSLAYDAAIIDRLVDMLTEMNQPSRPCYSRDFVDQICWAARYEGTQPQLRADTLAHACRNFLSSHRGAA
jgi:hypothetical protein